MIKRILLCVICFFVPFISFSLSKNEKFIQACTEGSLFKAEELLKHGANIEARDGCDHQTALVFAANRGHLSIVKMLIERKANINAQDDKGWTALSEASYRGRVDVVKYLLLNRASTLPSTSWLNSSEHGNALFWCIESEFNEYNQKIQIVKELLEHNAEPDGHDKYNRDSLSIAKIRGYKEIVELLELYRKKRMSYLNERVVATTTIVPKTEEEIRQEQERIAKMNEYTLLDAIRQQNYNKVKEYLDKKVNPNALLPNGESILNYAVNSHNFAIVKLLLERGANPNTKNELGTTALMTAVRCGDDAIVNVLLAHHVNLNQTDNMKRTALFYAIENDNDDILQSLIDAGVSINKKGMNDETAFLYACRLGNISACKKLANNGCNISVSDLYGTNALHLAVQKSDIELVNFILSHSSLRVSEKDDDGNDAMYYAEKNGDLEIIELLESYK